MQTGLNPLWQFCQGWLAKLQKMFIPDCLSHLQPCGKDKYCQERSRSPTNGENRMTPDHTGWPQITSNGPTAPPWDYFSFSKLGIYDFLAPCHHPACSKIGYKEVKRWPFWHRLGWFYHEFLAGILYLTNHWIFSPHFSCNEVIYRIKSNAILITWFGAAVGQIQHTGAWKVGFTPRPIRHKWPHWMQWNLTAMEPVAWATFWN